MNYKAGLETHLASILESEEAAWNSYKFYLLQLFSFIKGKGISGISVEEGESYLRLTLPANFDLNKTFLLFEALGVFPQTLWRNLMVSSLTSPYLLHKTAHFLPTIEFLRSSIGAKNNFSSSPRI